jgi:RNA-binding protein
MELTLSPGDRLRLKSDSHHLDPIVLLGAAGLSEAVLKEIDRALTTHELVKVRLPASDRQERERLFFEVAERLGAARVQLIGRAMVLFRPALTHDPYPNPSPAGRGANTSPRPRQRETGRASPGVAGYARRSGGYVRRSRG